MSTVEDAQSAAEMLKPCFQTFMFLFPFLTICNLPPNPSSVLQLDLADGGTGVFDVVWRCPP